MTTITKSVYLKASKLQVWSFLTEVEKVKIWFHAYDQDLAPGVAFRIIGQDSGNEIGTGTVQRMEPYDLLEYSFAIGPMDKASSTVLWTLEEVAGGTRLNLVHSGLSDSEEAFGLVLALDAGWDEHIGRMRAPLSEDA